MEAKLLLDENLSPRVALTLQADGVDAVHIRDRRGLGTSDAAVLKRAFKEDRVLVTANVRDFVKLARAAELHAGIVLIEDGALVYAEQVMVVRAALKALQGLDMVNRVLTVSLEGKAEFEDVPPGYCWTARACPRPSFVAPPTDRGRGRNSERSSPPREAAN